MELIRKKVQDVEPSRFDSLEEGDILFIDSSHVAKIGSDVNFLFFEILPRLAKGVLIHIHDVFVGFEYPLAWVAQGKAWNEMYVLRAFLQYNQSFKILAFNTFLEHFHQAEFQQHLPLCLKNTGGSIWLQKTK